MDLKFRTHTGDIVQGVGLEKALVQVADWLADNAHAIREEDCYATHVSEVIKDENLRVSLETAERIRVGVEPMGFWLWQRVNDALTGECVALLP